MLFLYFTALVLKPNISPAAATAGRRSLELQDVEGAASTAIGGAQTVVMGILLSA